MIEISPDPQERMIEALEAVRDQTNELQTFIAEFEAVNERLNELADESLGNTSLDKATLESMTYRSGQLRTRAIEIAAKVNEIGKQIEILGWGR